MRHIELPFNVIVVAIISFIVLVVVLSIFSYNTTESTKSLKNIKTDEVFILDIRASKCLNSYIDSLQQAEAEKILSLKITNYKCRDSDEATQCFYTFLNENNRKSCSLVLGCDKHSMEFLVVKENNINDCS